MEIAFESVVDVLEAAHAGDGDLEAWMEQLGDAMKRANPHAILTAVVAVQREPTRYRAVAGIANASGHESLAAFREMLPQFPPDRLDAYWRRAGRVVVHTSVARDDVAAGKIGTWFFDRWGIVDCVAMTAQAPDDVTLAVISFRDRAAELTPRESLVLGRAAAHMEAAFRIRLGVGSTVAVLRRDGRVSHAEGSATRASLRESLARHVRGVESRRSMRVRHDAERVTDGWTALIGGRFGLLEKSANGVREYHVVENPDHVWSARRLTDLEAQVLELSARGMPGKVVSYSLGIASSTVSDALVRAARKLGCASRMELIALAARVLGDQHVASPLSLTEAEHEVLRSLQRGASNGAIAAERGSSARTVANQVRSILRKTGRGSRRGLAGLDVEGRSASGTFRAVSRELTKKGA